MAALRELPEDQFSFSKCYASLTEALQAGPGVLDLFAGSRGFARACVTAADTWVLSFDLDRHPSEDLLAPKTQQTIIRLLNLRSFVAVGAGAVCASFSMAVTPPCRTRDHPEGRPDCSEKQQLKNMAGNAMLAFTLRVATLCYKLGVLFFVENPDGSWKRRADLTWEPLLKTGRVGDWRTDYCRFGTAWRKRTKFRTNSQLRGQKIGRSLPSKSLPCACHRVVV